MSKYGRVRERGDLTHRVSKLERAVDKLRTARRLVSAAIGSGGLRLHDGGSLNVTEGGNITVRDGGELSVLHDQTDHWILHVGRGAQNKYFLTIRRDDGSVAFEITTQPSGAQHWSLRDNQSSIVMSDDAATGVGLARPWLPVVLYPLFVPNTDDDQTGGKIGFSSIDDTELSGQETMWEGRATISHPWITVDGVWGQVSGDVEIEYTLRIDQNEVGSWTENSVEVGQRGPFNVQEWIGQDFRRVDVTAEVVSGSGTVACQVLGCYLRQT